MRHRTSRGVDPIVRQNRLAVTRGFLKAGVPLSKWDDLRELFESLGAAPLGCGSVTLRDIVPDVLSGSLEYISQQFRNAVNGDYALIVDGTTWAGREVMAILLRYTNEDD